MTEQANILQHRRDEGQALIEIADQGLQTPEDQQAWDQLRAEHQAGFAAVQNQVKLLTAGHVKAADADRAYRVESLDHNAR